MVGAARTGEAGAAEDAQPPRRGRPRLEAPSPDFLARREEILSAAVEVFHVKGYDAGTLEDVAEALDLRRASLYYYVRSKAHLLYMIFERALDTALGKLEAYRAIEDPAARLDALIRHQVLMVANEPSLFTVFFDHRPRLDERYEEAIRSRERRYLSTIREVVNDALEAGALPGIEPRYATQAIMGMASWTYKWFDPERHNAEEFAETCSRLILRKRAGRGRTGRKKPTTG